MPSKNSKPKIIISVINNFENDQRVQKVCHSLQKFGYEIEVICSNLRAEPQLDFPYKIHVLKLSAHQGMKMYLNYNWQLFWKLKKISRKNDILLANDLDALLPNYLWHKWRKNALVYDSHEIFSEMPSLQNRTLKKKFWKTLESLIVPQLKHFYTVSHSYANWFEEKYKVRPEVIRNVPIVKALSEEELTVQLPEINSSEKLIIYQGAVNYSRGIDKMIHSMTLIEDAQLWILGDGPKRKEYEGLTADLNLTDKVKFLGNLKPMQLKLVTPKADLGLSWEEDNGVSYRYALPNKIFDYTHAGVPILGTNLPEIKHTIEEYGLGQVIESHEIAHLASKIKEMLAEGKEKYRLNLKNAAQVLNWDNEEQRLLKIYQSIRSNSRTA